MARDILFSQTGREEMAKGMEQVIFAVAGTLGPKGRNVVLDKSDIGGTCIVSNDGVSIARDIQLADEFQNQGAQLLCEIASKTNDMVGDGTTTSMVLAYGMIKEGMKNLAAGANPILIRKGMKLGLQRALEELDQQAVTLSTGEEICQIASISAGDEEVGNMIGEAMAAVSNQGFITIEDGKTTETTLEIIEGMRMKSGYFSHYMCNEKQDKSVQYFNPYLLITDQPIDRFDQILSLLEKIAAEKAPLLIVSPEVTGDALSTIVLNDVKGVFQVTAIKAPGFSAMQRDLLEDLAVLTGGKGIFYELGISLEQVTLDMLGRAEKIRVTKDDTVVYGGKGTETEVARRVADIQKASQESTSEFDKERYRERVSKLTQGIAVIKVGAVSEIEMLEKKLRLEDAIAATKAAVADGILPGGGSAYLHAIAGLEQLEQEVEGEVKIGVQILKKSLEAPCRQICENAGVEGEVVIEKVRALGKGMGFDALAETYLPMVEGGIIDPLRVSKTALINGESVSSTLLTMEAVHVIRKGTEASLESFAG